MRDDPGRVVDEGDQVGLALGALSDQDTGAVHDITHPQLPGLGEGEAAAVMIARLLLGLIHQAMAGEQAVHGRGRQRQVCGHLGGLSGLADDQLHREFRVGLLGREQRLDHRRGQGAGLAAVGACFGQQGVEAATAVRLEPIAQRLGRHPGAGAAGDAVVARRPLGELLGEALGAWGQVHQLGNQPVAKQGNGLCGGQCQGSFMGAGLRVAQAKVPASRDPTPSTPAGPLPHGVGGRGRARPPACAGGGIRAERAGAGGTAHRWAAMRPGPR